MDRAALLRAAERLEIVASDIRAALGEDDTARGATRAERRRGLPDFARRAFLDARERGVDEMHVAELAMAVKELGFQHAWTPKRPDQIEHSLASALSKDPDTFERVPDRRGFWRLRQPG
jgi:hypothetical protein